MEWLWTQDGALQRTINQDWHSQALDQTFRYVTYLGLEQLLLPLLLLLSISRILRRTAWVGFVAWAIAGLGSIISKRLFPRLRPSNLPETIVAPDERIFFNSFPSGHTTVAFAIAFALLFALPLGKRQWMGSLALVLALLVGVSRVYRGVHWPTDVLGGICLGLLGALLADRLVPREVRSAE